MKRVKRYWRGTRHRQAELPGGVHGSTAWIAAKCRGPLPLVFQSIEEAAHPTHGFLQLLVADRSEADAEIAFARCAVEASRLDHHPGLHKKLFRQGLRRPACRRDVRERVYRSLGRRAGHAPHLVQRPQERTSKRMNS